MLIFSFCHIITLSYKEKDETANILLLGRYF